MRIISLIVAFGASAAAVVPAFCQNATPRPMAAQASPQTVTALCECRAAGRIFIQGELTCVNGKVVICAMDQNVTTWRGTGQACPES